jgi:hypothetical protein
LRNVVFDGELVRISGVIPLRNAVGFAGTETEYCGRNVAAENQLEAEFVLVAKILRPGFGALGHDPNKFWM